MQLRDFDINLLVIMEAIWTNRNVSLAARSLNLAQSTVSAALNRLRQSLNDEVFIWSGNIMSPTPLAEQVMPDVISILNGTRLLLDKSEGKLASVERRLAIATADYVTALLGADLITIAQKEAPNLSFDFVDMKPQAINRSTRPDVDLFIIPEAALRVGGLRKASLYSDTYVCIGASDNDKLHEEMNWDDFLSLPHVGYSAFPRVIFNHESMMWDDLDAEANYRLTMANYLTFPRIVANSKAVAIIPKRLAMMLTGQWNLKYIIPPLPVPDLHIVAYWKPAPMQDPALNWLIDTVKKITSDWVV